MQPVSPDGASVELRPTRYQYATASGEPGDWDANWLDVHGTVRTAAGESWTFEEPRLTTWRRKSFVADSEQPPRAVSR